MGSQGGVAMVGHKLALGNFEEGIRRVTSGLVRVGTSRQVDGHFNHDTGMGYVAEVKGEYDDAVRVKGKKLHVLISAAGSSGLNEEGHRYLNADLNR